MYDEGLDSRTLAYVQTIVQAASLNDDWKTALDKLLVALRAAFVFDNAAIYIVDQSTSNLEIAHARAVGRGKAAEADAAWGENLANQVLVKECVIVQDPNVSATDRISQAYLLGLPLFNGSKVFGVMVFVRFGGPVYDEAHITLATIVGGLVAALLFRKLHEKTRQQLSSLQQKAQLQDDFVATISHELRTPLGFIKGYSTTLLRADTTWDEETKQEFLTIIDEEADRLAQLIDNILESAKLQSRSVQLNVQPIRLDALLRDVVLRVRTRHKNLEVELELEQVPSIRGDNVRITQVFENLFSNAIKYAEGSRISVAVKEQKGSLLVIFSDRGPGIPKAYLPYIFERFYRVPGERTSKGSGLGLYICNQIITAHHGKMWVESELKKGTTFYIQLPIKSSI
jgi:signal transduction histidine kinase